MKQLLKKVLAITITCHFFSFVHAQDSSLIVGDKAPEIKYSKWLKGEPISSYDNNKLYVVEFWATWCGPCIAAMPHLSELAAKYKDKVVFVGVNVWEKIGDKPYESSLPNVTKFVNSMGNKMAYNVAVDNNEKYMATSWLQNAGVPGIPSTFLIKEGKVIWVGHPRVLDSIIGLVHSGNYDVELIRKAHKQSREYTIKARNDEKNLYEGIDQMIGAKEFDKAFALMDKTIAEKPITKYNMNIKKFNTYLLHIGEKQAIEFAQEWMKKEGARVGIYLAQSVVEKEGFSKEMYKYAAQWFEPSAEGANVNPLLYSYLAKCYYLSGNQEKAISTQEKAVAAAREAVKNGKFVGVIHDYTITEYEETLKKYKKEGK